MKYLSLILLAIAFLGCTKNKCDDIDAQIITVYKRSFYLTFVDQAGNNLINDMGTGFDTASVKVYEVNNNLLPREFETKGNTQPPFGKHTFNLIVPYIFDDPDIVYKPVCKRLYINLGNDRDTLDYCFNTIKGRCGPEVIDLTARFNGKIFHEEASVGGFIEATVVK